MQSDDETLAGDVIVFAFQGFFEFTCSSPPLGADRTAALLQAIA